MIAEGTIVRYYARDGSVVKGKVIHWFESVTGWHTVCIDSWANRVLVNDLLD